MLLTGRIALTRLIAVADVTNVSNGSLADAAKPYLSSGARQPCWLTHDARLFGLAVCRLACISWRLAFGNTVGVVWLSDVALLAAFCLIVYLGLAIILAACRGMRRNAVTSKMSAWKLAVVVAMISSCWASIAAAANISLERTLVADDGSSLVDLTGVGLATALSEVRSALRAVASPCLIEPASITNVDAIYGVLTPTSWQLSLYFAAMSIYLLAIWLFRGVSRGTRYADTDKAGLVSQPVDPSPLTNLARIASGPTT